MAIIKIFGLLLLTVLLESSGVFSVTDHQVTQIQAGAKSANQLAKAMQSTNFLGVVQKAASVVPIASAIVSFVGFILSFVGTSESPELLEIKRLFKEVDTRFDEVEQHLNDIQKEITLAQLKIELSQTEHNINGNYVHLRNIYQSSLASKETERDIFLTSFENTCTNCALTLYQVIMGTDHVFIGDLFKSLMGPLNNDRKHMQTYMIGTLQLLMKSITIELVYQKLKYGEGIYDIHKQKWSARVQNVTAKMSTIDAMVKNKYYDQAGIDIDRTALEQRSLSHQDFSLKLYTMLATKYYWRAWLVIVYDPIYGGNRHMNQECDGFLKYRFHGRNIVIASADLGNRPLNKSEAREIINHLPQSYSYTQCSPNQVSNYPALNCHTDRQYYNAQEVFNGLPANIQASYCSPYRAVGVLDPHAHISFRAPPERLFHMPTAGRQPYEVYFFE